MSYAALGTFTGLGEWTTREAQWRDTATPVYGPVWYEGYGGWRYGEAWYRPDTGWDMSTAFWQHERISPEWVGV